MPDLLHGVLYFIWPTGVAMSVADRVLWCLMFWLPALAFLYTIFVIGISIRWAVSRAHRPAPHTAVLIYMILAALWWSIPVSLMAIVGGLAGGNVQPHGYILGWGIVAFPCLLAGVVTFIFGHRPRPITQAASPPR